MKTFFLIFQIESGLIVIVYTDGSLADTYLLNTQDCLKYWKIWLSRLGSFLNSERENNACKSYGLFFN